MNQKKVKALRKKLKFKISPADGYKADYRVAKKVTKVVYFKDKFGEPQATTVERQVIVNAAKFQYRKVRKLFGEMV
jgi:hypothetical protein